MSPESRIRNSGPGLENQNTKMLRFIFQAILSMIQHQQLRANNNNAQHDPEERKFEEELERQTGTIGGKPQPKRGDKKEAEQSYTVMEVR